MAEKPVRLRFLEEELANPKVAKAAARSEKATVKAGKAQGKIPVKHKLRRESSSAANVRKKLRFGKLVLDEVEAPKPQKGVKDAATRAPLDTVSGTAHREVQQYEEDNVGGGEGSASDGRSCRRRCPCDGTCPLFQQAEKV